MANTKVFPEEGPLSDKGKWKSIRDSLAFDYIAGFEFQFEPFFEAPHILGHHSPISPPALTKTYRQEVAAKLLINTK